MAVSGGGGGGGGVGRGRGRCRALALAVRWSGRAKEEEQAKECCHIHKSPSSPSGGDITELRFVTS